MRARLLINSRTDVALAAGADGVHLRADDLSPREVRAVVRLSAHQPPATDHFLVAASCHTAADVFHAESEAADFAVFAPVFEKKDAPAFEKPMFERKDAQPTGLAALREVCRAKIPVLALGGVNVENAASCLNAGAAGIAAIRLFQENRIEDLFARCGRSDTMDPTVPTEPTQLLSRSQASACGDGRPRPPMPSASSAAACGHNNSGPALVRIPAGWFLMGCDTRQDNEKPVHRVWVDEFLLAARQVTNADYGRFLREAAPPPPPPPFWSDPAFNHPQQPVVGVSWFEAIRYCEWLSASTGGKFRLPTEAEWERAARGGTNDDDEDAAAGALYPWGDAPPQSLPDYADRCAGHWQTGPEPVGLGDPNAFGLYNMCDNVHEWCSDWYAADYYAVSPERNPGGTESGERRASRGGSWRHHVKMSRCAARSSIPPEFKYADYGFRVACDVQLQVRG